MTRHDVMSRLDCHHRQPWPQGLDHKRARALNLENGAKFYANLELLYLQDNDPPNCIWNLDESGCQVSQNGLGKVFAKRRIGGVHQTIPAERKWLSVLSAVNGDGGTIPNYNIFKEVRRMKDNVIFCEEGVLLEMQKKGWMDIKHFQE